MEKIEGEEETEHIHIFAWNWKHSVLLCTCFEVFELIRGLNWLCCISFCQYGDFCMLNLPLLEHIVMLAQHSVGHWFVYCNSFV